MTQLLSMFLIFSGIFFVVVAGIGVIRMPDVFLRMSAATKASTLGLGLILLGTAVYFGSLGVASRAIATSFFVLLTGPVSAHMLGRAAYSDGCELWEKTQLDELRERYVTQEASLGSVPESHSAHREGEDTGG